MHEPELTEKINPSAQQDGNYKQVKQAYQPDENKIREAEALLLTIDLVFGELSQPLTVLLGLSHLLLAKTDQNDPIAADLMVISKQVNRISETIKGIEYLTHYNPTL